jgi:glutamyl-tRNA reductase
MRVSVMLDANGANTTASAAVLAAASHKTLVGTTAIVLAGTGPVGQRVARLLVRQQARVLVVSRQLARAEVVCEQLRKLESSANVSAVEQNQIAGQLTEAQIVFAAGAAGVQLLSHAEWTSAKKLRVLVDLNAVPPAGIEGVEAKDKGAERDGVLCYGALGVGGLKMKIHRAALQQLFTRNDLVLDAEDIFAIGQKLSDGAFF